MNVEEYIITVASMSPVLLLFLSHISQKPVYKIITEIESLLPKLLYYGLISSIKPFNFIVLKRPSVPMIFKPSLLASFLPLRSSIISKLPLSRAKANCFSLTFINNGLQHSNYSLVTRLLYGQKIQALKCSFSLILSSLITLRGNHYSLEQQA